MRMLLLCLIFFNDTATTEIYTLSLHDALPISTSRQARSCRSSRAALDPISIQRNAAIVHSSIDSAQKARLLARSEEHTSELQSRQYLVCRLLLEKKNK